MQVVLICCQALVVCMHAGGSILLPGVGVRICMQVVKVLHGADSDVVWLQRDFGIYVANLFDTGQAARVLAFPSAGLAYALSRFCSVKVHVSPETGWIC